MSRRPRSRQGAPPRRRPPACFESGSCNRAGRAPGPQGVVESGGKAACTHDQAFAAIHDSGPSTRQSQPGRKRRLATSRVVGGRASRGLTSIFPPSLHLPSLPASLPPYLGTPCFLAHVQQRVAFLPAQTPPTCLHFLLSATCTVAREVGLPWDPPSLPPSLPPFLPPSFPFPTWNVSNARVKLSTLAERKRDFRRSPVFMAWRGCVFNAEKEREAKQEGREGRRAGGNGRGE